MHVRAALGLDRRKARLRRQIDPQECHEHQVEASDRAELICTCRMALSCGARSKVSLIGTLETPKEPGSGAFQWDYSATTLQRQPGDILTAPPASAPAHRTHPRTQHGTNCMVS